MKSRRELYNLHQLNQGRGEKKRKKWKIWLENGGNTVYLAWQFLFPLMMSLVSELTIASSLNSLSCPQRERNILAIYQPHFFRLSALLSSLGNTCWSKFITKFPNESVSSRGLRLLNQQSANTEVNQLWRFSNDEYIEANYNGTLCCIPLEQKAQMMCSSGL